MLRETLILLLLVLCGCGNEKLPPEELLEKAKNEYENGQYKKANKYLRELDCEYSWNENSMDGLLYLAKSTLESGRRALVHGQKDLLECVQVCNLIIIYKPDYALDNDVHMIKMDAYMAMTSFNVQLSDQMAKKVIDTAEEYKKDATENNKLDCYTKNAAKVLEMSKKCRIYITARAIEQTKYTSKDDAAVNLIDLAENDPKYGIKYPELYYRKLERMMRSSAKPDNLVATLQELNAYDDGEYTWTKKAIELIKSKYPSFSEKEKRRFDQLERVVYKDLSHNNNKHSE